MRLKREAPTPLYLQLKNALVSDIDAGQYQPHDRLMSERELGEKFKVSRMTVRQALTEMIREGFLYTQVGKGTYVSESKIKQELQTLTGFTQDMAARGTVASGQVLEARIIPATLTLAAIFSVPMNTEFVLLSRLRLSDGIPLAIEEAYIRHQVRSGILMHDFSKESLYNVLATHYNTILIRAEQTMEASLATAKEAELLQITSPSPILRIERLSYNEQNTLVEYVISAYRGDRYKFHTTLQS
jgi:GntR family transcriptional regulator, N-acetylglucosamine utilization regulator